MMKEVVIQDLKRTVKNVEKVWNLVHSDSHFKYQSSFLCGNIEAVV